MAILPWEAVTDGRTACAHCRCPAVELPERRTQLAERRVRAAARPGDAFRPRTGRETQPAETPVRGGEVPAGVLPGDGPGGHREHETRADAEAALPPAHSTGAAHAAVERGAGAARPGDSPHSRHGADGNNARPALHVLPHREPA